MPLLALSLAPVVVLFWFFYVWDKYEKEPKELLIKLFLWGAAGVAPAVFLGTVISTLLQSVVPVYLFSYVLLENFLAIALVEEGVKLGVVMLFAYKHRAFNEPYDGIIYAVTVSLGFAAIENILYVYQGGVSVAILRMLLAVPAHALFGAFMGYYLGHARFSMLSEASYLRRALIIPTLLHGTYNSLLSTAQPLFALLVIPLSLYMWWAALRYVRSASDRSPFKP